MFQFLSSLTLILLSGTLFCQNITDLLTRKNPEGIFDSKIRIGIIENAHHFVLEGDAVLKRADGKTLGSIQGKYKVSADKSSIVVGKDRYPANKIAFFPKFSFISVGDKIFRGTISVYNINGRLTVVNILDLDDYVRGVVNKEIIPSWPLEAKKVQAVLARTYAVYQKIYNKRSDLFDLAPTILDQVYGGLSREDLSANKAVEETKGVIISYKNMPAQIFFHSTCGGNTASGKEVWGKEIPYLQSVACPYCSKSRLYRWKRNISKRIIVSSLKKGGVKISSLKSIKTRRKGRRVTDVVINGKAVAVNTFRSLVGYSVIWSNDFSVSILGSNVVFKGKGAGHGVGVCQWGMAELAKKGKSYEWILKYYLKNVELKKIY